MKALLVKAAGGIRDLSVPLSQSGYDIETASGAAEALKAVSDRHHDLVVVESPLADGSAREVAAAAAKGGGSDVVLVAASSQADRLADSLGRVGVHVIAKSASDAEVRSVLRVVATAKVRLSALEEKNMRLLRRLSEERALCERKCELCRVLGISEDEAHRMMERRAMDARITLLDAGSMLCAEASSRQARGGAAGGANQTLGK